MTDGQFYGAILWHHFMAPFYGACVLGFSFSVKVAFYQTDSADHQLRTRMWTHRAESMQQKSPVYTEADCVYNGKAIRLKNTVQAILLLLLLLFFMP